MSSSEEFCPAPAEEEDLSSFSEASESSFSDFEPKKKAPTRKRKAASSKKKASPKKKTSSKKKSTKKAPAKKNASAKRKPAVKKVSDKEAKAMIIEYMAEQNRPFNAIMLSQNLHNEVKKAQAVRLLKQLAASGKLELYQNKKQLIYWISQDGLETAPDHELKEMDQRLKELRDGTKEDKKASQQLKSQVKSLMVTPSDADLEKNIPLLEESVKRKREEVARLTAATANFDPKEAENLTKRLAFLKKEYLKRKKSFLYGLKQLEDLQNKKIDWEEWGLDKDEDVAFDANQLTMEFIQNSIAPKEPEVVVEIASAPPVKKAKIEDAGEARDVVEEDVEDDDDENDDSGSLIMKNATSPKRSPQEIPPTLIDISDD